MDIIFFLCCDYVYIVQGDTFDLTLMYVDNVVVYISLKYVSWRGIYFVFLLINVEKKWYYVTYSMYYE